LGTAQALRPSDPEKEIRVLADTLLQERKYAEAERLFSDIPPSALPHVPQSVGLLRARGNFRARRSRYTAAAADYAQAIEFDPSHPRDWQNLAVLLVESLQLDAYREHCRKSLNRFRNTTNPTAAEQIAGNCLLLPESGIELSVVVELTNFAASATNHERIGWFEFAKALAEYRQDHFTGAIEWSQKALARGGVLEREVLAEIVLAMAHRRLMQADEARRALGNALSKIDKRLPNPDSSDLGPDWSVRLTVRIVTREAKNLIQGD
jgi:tetratricopeptide (TPR) repeat protein